MEYKTQCGCIVVQSPPNFRIKYCPLHESAPDLYEALEVANTAIHNAIRYEPAGEYRKLLQQYLIQIREALAKTEMK